MKQSMKRRIKDLSVKLGMNHVLAFTPIELLVVIGINGILASLLLPRKGSDPEFDSEKNSAPEGLPRGQGPRIAR
jgi:type II secretory pathway pseudopilin PulG